MHKSNACMHSLSSKRSYQKYMLETNSNLLLLRKRGHIKSDCRHKKKKCLACGKVGHTKWTCRRHQRAAKNGLDPEAKAYRGNQLHNPRCRSTESGVSKTFLKSHMTAKSGVNSCGTKPFWDVSSAYRRPVSLLVKPMRELVKTEYENYR